MNQDLELIFEKFNQLNVLIIGDLMVDSYVWGKADRISPEAPVPVVNVQKREIRLGGAGNVVVNLKALGANPMLFAALGNDSMADEVIQIFKDNNLSTEGLIMVDDRPTTVKERVIAAHQQLVRLDTESDLPLEPKDEELLLNIILEALPQANVVLFQDYDKGVLQQNLIEKVIQKANELAIPTVVDPKKRNFFFYKNVSLFKPNLKEIKEGLGINFDSKNKIETEKTVSILIERLNAKGVFLTLSEQGVYIDYHSQKHHIPAHLRNIADVSGAGDTVISIASCAIALNLDPKIIAGLANLGGGLVCESLGVVSINKAKLLQEAKELL